MNVFERGLRVTFITTALLVARATGCDAVSLAESADAMIAHVEAVIRGRFEHIAKYIVKEHYAVYRNGAAETAAEQTVQVVYQKSTGIIYTTVSKDGSSMWLSRAIEPALESEKEVNDVTTRHQVMLTADNYELEVEPARNSLNGRDCFVLDLKPRRKSPYLLNGKAWVCKLTFATADKLLEMYERWGEARLLEDRSALEYAINMGRGSLWLILSSEQYAKLKK